MQVIREAMKEQDIMTLKFVIHALETYPLEIVLKTLKESLKEKENELQKIKETDESD